jgi:hypothetical protein
LQLILSNAQNRSSSRPAKNLRTDTGALGILRPATQQRRHRVFHAHEVMNVLYSGLDAVIEDVWRHTGIKT